MLHQLQAALRIGQARLNLQLIVVIEQLRIQTTGMRIHALQAKLCGQLGYGVQLRLGIGSVLEAAAGGHNVVEQGRGKVAAFPELLYADISLTLAQLGAIGVDQQRQVTKLWWLPAKGSVG